MIPPSPAVIFAVDPGNTSGYAALMVAPEPNLVEVGQINFTLKQYTRSACSVVSDFDQRWRTQEWNFVQQPALVAIEDQYLGKNVDSLKKLARNAGMWEGAARHYGFEHDYINPSTWIAAELGRGLRTNQVEKLARQRVAALYGKQLGRKLSEHECCAILIGRYTAIREWRKGAAR